MDLLKKAKTVIREAANRRPERADAPASERTRTTTRSGDETPTRSTPTRLRSVASEDARSSRPPSRPATLDAATDFSVGEIRFARNEESLATQERRVGPGDEPSSFEVGDLDYYLDRKADFEARHPDLEAPDYYEQYGDRYIREFAELAPELSEEGREWVAETRDNLQQAFEDLRAEDPEAFDRLEQDPEALREWAFDSHSNAYLDAGFADLPPEDILQIATTPSFEDFFDSQALKEAVEVGVQAVVANPSLVAEVPAEVLEQVNDFISDKVIEVGTDTASAFGDITDSAFDAIGEGVETVLEGVGGVLPGPLGDLVGSAGGLFGGGVDGLGDLLEGGFDGVGAIFEEVVGGGTDVVNTVIDTVGDVAGAVIEAPISFIDGIFDLDGPAEAVGGFLGEAVEETFETVSEVTGTVGDAGGAVVDFGGDVLDAGGDIVGGGVDFVTGLF